MCAWLAVMLLCGGVSLPYPMFLAFQSVISFLLLGFGLFRLRTGFPTKLAVAGACVAFASVLLLLLQTIPLPFGVWSQLPGRELVVKSFELLGAVNPWQPLTLSLSGTRADAIAILPMLAGYFAALTLTRSDYARIAVVVVSCALVGLIISMLQRLQGIDSFWYFYGTLSGSQVVGTFGNRNFFAAQLFSSIPFIAALAMTASSKFGIKPFIIAVFALVYVGVLVAGLGAVGSRAGIALAMVSVLLSIAYVYRMSSDTSRRAGSRFILPVALGAFFIIAQAGMVGILRFTSSEPMDDFRGTIYDISLKAAKSFSPAGSGFGTFVPVYQMFETPAATIENYANHAHNDWLEIALEGGLPAVVLLLVFVGIVLMSVFAISRLSFGLIPHAYLRASVVSILLLLAHSIVDYPLRTPALMAFFAVCCGFLTLGRAMEKPSAPLSGPRILKSRNTTENPGFKNMRPKPSGGPLKHQVKQ